MLCPIEDAIKNRTEVLANLSKYGIDEKHRSKLEENLEFFKEQRTKKNKK